MDYGYDSNESGLHRSRHSLEKDMKEMRYEGGPTASSAQCVKIFNPTLLSS
jgi:hypothetical protein